MTLFIFNNIQLPWCVYFEKEQETIERMLRGTSIGIVHGSGLGDDIMVSMGVKSFPSVVLVKDNKPYSYSGYMNAGSIVDRILFILKEYDGKIQGFDKKKGLKHVRSLPTGRLSYK